MKNKLLLSLLGFFITTNLIAQPIQMIKIKSFEKTFSEPKQPIRTVERTPGEIKVSYKIDFVTIRGGKGSQTEEEWGIPGFNQIYENNKPIVPIRKDFYNIPADYTVELETNVGEYICYHTCLKLGESLDPEFTEKWGEEISDKRKGNLFPEKAISKSLDGISRDTRIICIEVCPFQYDSNDSTLICHTDISYTIKYKKAVKSENQNPLSVNHFYEGNPIIDMSESILEDSQLKEIGDIEPAGPNGKSILVITNSVFSNAAEKYALWKRRLGFDVEIKKSLLWNQNKIKSTIQDHYRKDSHLTYVLLIGDSSFLPSEELLTESDSSNPGVPYASDFGYRCLDDENDIIPDIYLGRIPAANNDEALATIDKIINYEKNGLSNDEAYSRLVLAAYLQQGNDPIQENARFIRTAEDIVENYYDLTGIIPSRNYRRQSNLTTHWSRKYYRYEPISSELLNSNVWSTTPQSLASDISKGTWGIIYRGHGTIDGWQSLGFETKHLDLIESSDTPLYFSITCNSGAFHKDPQTGKPISSFATNLLTKPNGGACGVIASSTVSFSGRNDSMILGMLDGLIPSDYWTPIMNNNRAEYLTKYIGRQRMGEMLEHGLMRMEQWDQFQTKKEKILNTWRIFHIFGDPSMKIYMSKPGMPACSKITRTSSNIKFNVFLYNYTILIRNERTGELTTIISPANVDYPTLEEENISITILANNCLPKIDLGKNCINL